MTIKIKIESDRYHVIKVRDEGSPNEISIQCKIIGDLLKLRELFENNVLGITVKKIEPTEPEGS